MACLVARTRHRLHNRGYACASTGVARFKQIGGTAETAIYNGGSLWADYWIETITELRCDLVSSGKLDEALVDRFLTYCADPNWWTQTIAFTALYGRASVA